MGFNDLLDDRKSQSTSFNRLITSNPVKLLEDQWKFFLWDTDSGILDGYLGPVIFFF